MNTLRHNRRNRNARAHNQESGVALIVALLALVLVAAITAGMMILSTTETSISANFRDEQTAFFSSKAGIEEVRDRLRIAATNTLRPGGAPAVTTFAGSPGGVVYIVNPNAALGETQANILTSYGDDEICKETQTIAVPCGNNAMGQLVATPGAWETTVLASPTYAAAPVFPWKWVRINLRQNNENNTAAPSYNTNGQNTAQMVCWNGTNEYADPNAPNGALTDLGCTVPNMPVYVLTALSVTPTGTRRMVQAEVAEDKYPFTTPAALTMDGSLTTFNGGSSNQWGVNGNDSPGCGVATVGPPVHAIGALNPAAVATIDAGINRPNNITGSGATTPDVADVSGTMPANLQSVSSLQTLVSTMKSNVTQPVINGPASGLPNYGTVANPQIIYVNGDLTLSGNAQGYGILVVTGTLTIKGTVGWNGIVLVVGKGVFNTDGTDQYNGAVVVANTVDALGNPLPVQGTSQVHVNGGGHGGFQYSSGCIASASLLSTFHLAAIRELMR
jgi:hypothetical protein